VEEVLYMTREGASTSRAWLLVPVLAILAVATLSFSAAARSAGARFFDSLRIAAPARVNVGISAAAGVNGNRSLQQVVSDMAADKASVTTDEADQAAPNLVVASQMAGFAAQLPRLRKDTPKFLVLGARTIQMSVDHNRLQTILHEAGRSDVVLATAVDGAVLAVQDPRAIRSQYGNCPVPDNSLQGQIAGPPPASTDNSDCLVLFESPSVAVTAPNGLDVHPLVEIGLELSGMTPEQAQEFLQTFDWKSTLGLAMPRFVRSYTLVEVNGAKGMLLGTAGRRGPTYVLIWAKNGMVYSLTGYGNPGEAIPMANSVQ
jgi:hypothetical protein